jgi:outer membrane protein assembly factor BamB
MNKATSTTCVLVGCVLLLGANRVCAQDWPQWRGPNRDNKVTGFTAPKTWPKTLTQKWKIKVGLGESSPLLVGDKLYVFARQGGDEVTLCLKASDGSEVWKDKYEAVAVKPPAASHPGPRSTPAVAEGKVCTLGVGGVVSCLDASSGQVVWRKNTKSWPQFFTSTSPLIAEGKCIVYVDALTAYDLASGESKWQWSGAKTPYGSPVLMTVEGTKQVVTPAAGSLDGVSLADGKLLWQVKFGFGDKDYQSNFSTPIIGGQTVIYSVAPKAKGGYTMALKIEKKGDGFAATELWKKDMASDKYYTPVLRDGLLFGVSAKGRNFFCMDAKTGDVLWTDKAKRGDCGNILNAGSVLVALTSDSYLIVFEPSNKEFKELARYKVSDKEGLAGPWSCPILAGNRLFVKDRDSLALWTIE